MMKPVSCRGFQKGFQGVSNFPQGVSKWFQKQTQNWIIVSTIYTKVRFYHR